MTINQSNHLLLNKEIVIDITEKYAKNLRSHTIIHVRMNRWNSQVFLEYFYFFVIFPLAHLHLRVHSRLTSKTIETTVRTRLTERRRLGSLKYARLVLIALQNATSRHVKSVSVR